MPGPDPFAGDGEFRLADGQPYRHALAQVVDGRAVVWAHCWTRRGQWGGREFSAEAWRRLRLLSESDVADILGDNSCALGRLETPESCPA